MLRPSLALSKSGLYSRNIEYETRYCPGLAKNIFNRGVVFIFVVLIDY